MKLATMNDHSGVTTRLEMGMKIKGAQNSKSPELLVPESTIAQELRNQNKKAKNNTTCKTYFNLELIRK